MYLASSSAGAAEADGWRPSFPGQRPPFGAANEAAVTHGATSPRRLGPLAGEFAAALLADPGTPEYLREPAYARSVMAWARAEATVELLSEWLTGQDLEAGLTEVTRSAETEDRDGGRDSGRTTRRSVSRRTASVVEQLRRAEVLAMHLRDRLGLAPLARARLGKDVASTRADLARIWAEQAKAEAAEAAEAPREVSG